MGRPPDTIPAILNGKIGRYSPASLSTGPGLFETFRAIRGRGVFIEKHLERIAASASALGIPFNLTINELALQVRELAEFSHMEDARMKLALAGDERGHSLHLAAFEMPQTGVPFKCRTLCVSAGLLSRHKALERTVYDDACAEGAREGFDETILLCATTGPDDSVCEGTITNVFSVMDGVLTTPPLTLPILPGITRGVVMELARDAEIEVVEKEFSKGDFLEADEIFLTNSIRGVVPVTHVDGKKFASGRLTERLVVLYNEIVLKTTGVF